MKNHLYLILLFYFFVSSKIISQNNSIDSGDIINFTKPIKTINSFSNTKTVNKEGKLVNELSSNKSPVEYLPSWVSFKVLDIGKVNTKIEALNFIWTRFRSSKRYNNIIYVIDTNALKYGVKTKNSNQNSSDPGVVSFGLLTLPFKARPNKGSLEFDLEFNLNTTLNVRVLRLWNSEVNLQFGAGVGSTSLLLTTADNVSTKQDLAILTLLGGAMLKYKKVQGGVYIGGDFMNNNDVNNWKYNGNLWIGFGIGFQVFQVSTDKESKKGS